MTDESEDARPMSAEIMLAMMDGATYEDAAASIAERVRINEKARTIEHKPIEEWPPFEMAWDGDRGCFHHSQDGVSAKALEGDDIRLVWVALSNLDAVLQDWNRRTAEEVWSVGDPSKAARVIVHCSEGGKLSPVWVVPTTLSKVGLVGGNHRLAIARAKGVQSLPIIFHAKDLENLRPLFPELSPPAA